MGALLADEPAQATGDDTDEPAKRAQYGCEDQPVLPTWGQSPHSAGAAGKAKERGGQGPVERSASTESKDTGRNSQKQEARLPEANGFRG